MNRKLSKWFYATALLLTVPTMGSTRPKEVPPQPGFECAAGKPFDDAVWGSATLDAAGKIVRSDWTWQTPHTQNRFKLVILQFGDSKGLEEVSGDASASLSWLTEPNAVTKAEKRMVQITSSSQKRYIWGALATGNIEKSYSPGVVVHWSDFLAFAKGTAVINLNLLDEKWRFIDSVSIEPSLVLKADLEIQAMLKALNARIAKFGSECTKVDDIVERDIVV